MTQPDGGIPDDAIASLAAFSTKSQEDWDAEMRGRTTNPFLKFVSGWSGVLAGIIGAGNSALNALMQIGTLIWKVGGIIIDDVGDFINAALSNANTALTNAGHALSQIGSLIIRVGVDFIDDVGDFIVAALSNANTAITNAAHALGQMQAGWAAFFNGWFGSGGTGSVDDVTYTIEAIKTAIFNGVTVYGFAFDEVAWPVPAHVEAKSLLFGGGQNGSGGTGGLHGSVLGGPLDLTGIAALDIQIGTAGNRTYIREAATPAHSGTILMQSPVHGSAGGGVAEMGLLTPTTSLPGNGGNGGSGGPDGTSSTPGESTPMAVGGSGGSSGFAGSSGQPGGSVAVSGEIKCGGAGGGGGGRATGLLGGGGNGGAGGYPGGAGGGRGQGWSGGSNGSVGPGAPGVAFLYLKLMNGA